MDNEYEQLKSDVLDEIEAILIDNADSLWIDIKKAIDEFVNKLASIFNF